MLVILIAINLVVFYFLYGFHPNNDTDSYIYLIRAFRGQDAPVFPNRYLNPFYAVVGSHLLGFIPPAAAIVVTNIFFYYGTVLLTYGLIRRVFKNNFIGFVSALFVMTGYTMLRYALTQVQDMGGYFWYILVAYASWRWWEEKKDYWLYLGGAAVGFGMLTKESGCMTALFFAALLLFKDIKIREKIICFVKFSFLPFVTLVINQMRGLDMAYSSKDWFIGNWITYAKGNYTMFKLFGVNATTYNFLWVLFFIGIYFFYKNRKNTDRDIKIYFLAILLPSLSYFAWPVFISRTVFISAWLIIPAAAYGIYRIFARGNYFRYLACAAVVLGVVCPFVLQSTLKYAHVFKIYEDCGKSLGCSWHYFWNNRQGFSDQG